MKKTLLLTVLCSLGLIANATSPLLPSNAKKTTLGTNRITTKPKHTRVMPGLNGEPITDQPAGMLKDNQTVNAWSVFDSDGARINPFSNLYSKIVEDSQGNIYIYDILPQRFDRTYVKLTKVDEETYVMHTPQAISKSELDPSATLFLTRAVYTPGSNDIYLPEWNQDSTAINGDVYFTYKDGVLKQAEFSTTDSLPQIGRIPKEVIALTDSTGSYFSGYCVGQYTLKQMTDPLTTLPENAELEDFYITYNTSDGTGTKDLKGTIIGNEIYIQNLVHREEPVQDPDNYIKGTIDGNKVTFSRQYVGPSYNWGVHMFLTPLTETVVEGFRTYTSTDAIEFTYDAEQRILTSSEKDAISYNDGSEGLANLIGGYVHPIFTGYTLDPVTPQAAMIKEFFMYDSVLKYGSIGVTLPEYSTDNKKLNYKNLYFRIFVDDNDDTPYTFSESKGYMGIGEDKTDISVLYRDGENFWDTREGFFRIYVNDVFTKNIGIQLIYRTESGEKTSEIVWSKHSAVADLNTDHTAVITEYFDLAGNLVSNPTSGIYIQRTHYANGSTKTTKVIK